MNALWEGVSNQVQNSQPVALFLDALIKSVMLLALAGALSSVWRRASAASRHLVWFLAVASLPFLPVLAALQPSWHRPLWSVSTGVASGNQMSLELEIGPATSATSPGSKAAPIRPDATPVSNHPSSPGQVFAARFSDNWLTLAFVAWVTGVVLALAYLIFGQFQLGELSRKAHRLTGDSWTQMLEKAGAALRLRRRAILLQSAESVMPLTWGWLRPVVLLPAGFEQWPEERQRIVLLHELAHVKRWDCLTQLLARLVCALYWFNPLVWLAAGRMRVERERACDDLVLAGGCRAANYANHLVEIAKSFRRVPQAAAIAMARASGLERRIAAIVDGSRNRRLRLATSVVILLIASGIAICLAGSGTGVARTSKSKASQLRHQQIIRLETFSAAKEKQAETLAAAAGEQISPRFEHFFDAATQGDWRTVTNMYEGFKEHAPQYSHKGQHPDWSLRTSYWNPVLEICLAYDQIVNGAPKYNQLAIDDILNSIPPGSIYFGGTDPGRGLPTAFCKSQIEANPFYTLTQNALADGTYLEYLQETYGEQSTLLDQFIRARRSNAGLQILDSEMRQAKQTLDSQSNAGPDDPAFKAAEHKVGDLNQKISDITGGIWTGLEAQAKVAGTNSTKGYIYIPTSGDLQKCFQDYVTDVERRLKEHKLKPGEHVTEVTNAYGAPPSLEISGRTAVMAVNALLAKIIFDKNPNHQFYIEQSFPLDWVYPHLEPHGLIFKINRQPLAELPDAVVQQDHKYWQGLVEGMIGDWLTEKTSVKNIAAFARKVFLQHNLNGFDGDPVFVRNDYACKMFSKERASIAGLYVWRMHHAANAEEKERMAREADFAYRQAFALCPYSVEATKGYAAFLKSQNRMADAILISETAAAFPSHSNSKGVKSRKSAAETPKPPLFELRLVQDAPSAAAQRMTLVSQNQATGQTYSEQLYVQKTVLLDQTAIQSAKATRDALGQPIIDINFTDAGRKKFAEVSRHNIGRRLAIIIDGRVCSAPVIQSEISEGKAQITGAFTEQETEALARKINEATGH